MSVFLIHFYIIYSIVWVSIYPGVVQGLFFNV
jgi:hypothetical protein